MCICNSRDRRWWSVVGSGCGGPWMRSFLLLLLLLHSKPSTAFLGRFFFPRTVVFTIDDNAADDNDANNSKDVSGAREVAVDDYFLQLAIAQAKQGERANEVPIGCVVVQQQTLKNYNNATSTMYRILSQAHNRVEQLHDASAHAELLALRQAGRRLQNWRLSSSSSPNNNDDGELSRTVTTTLYCTCEPCVMCWSACHAFRVQRIVYGADDLRLGAITTGNVKIDNSMSNWTHPFHTISQVRGGVRQQECGDLLRNFFRKRRKSQTQDKKKKKRSIWSRWWK